MVEARKEVHKWFKLDDLEKIEKLENNLDIYYKVSLFYNFITEIGISYKFRIISRKITRQIFDPLIPIYYEIVEPYIWLNREKGTKLGWYARYVYDSILKKRKNNKEIYKPTIFQLNRKE